LKILVTVRVRFRARRGLGTRIPQRWGERFRMVTAFKAAAIGFGIGLSLEGGS
jgi:hypothetical protein